MHYLNAVVMFTFCRPVYMFMEDVGTVRVCVDKIGDTDQTITVIVNGGVYNYDQSYILNPSFFVSLQPLSQDPSIGC